MTATDDAALIARVIASDDRHAFSTLVRRHQAPVRAFLVRLCCGDTATADDLAQVTFLRAYRHIASYRNQGEFVSWLFALAYRAFLSEKRRVRHARETLDADSDARHAGANVERSLTLDLDRAMARLRPEERAALSLCLSWGLSHEEAARVLDCPVGTVKSLILRGREKLRPDLSSYQETDPLTRELEP